MSAFDNATVSVSLDAIAHNTALLARHAPTAQVMAVVKADGYGHGLIPSARAARAGGAQWLGVVGIDEAAALRAAGDTGSILAWRTGAQSDFATAVSLDVAVSAAAPEALEAIAAAARAAGGRASVHLALDSGLGREGAPLGEQWDVLLAAAASLDTALVDVCGVWSHLAFADDPHHPTIDAQRAAFIAGAEQAQSVGLDIRLRHLANSAATLTRPDLHFDLVRPGLAVYGVSPIPADGAAFGLRPAMTFRAPVFAVKQLPAGHGIGYGHTYHATHDTTVVVAAAGYAEGVPRSAGNSAPVQINGGRFTISGRVSMDQVSIDIGAHPVAVGDVVTFFGPGDSGEPTVEEFARACGTISYEIITRLGARAARVYVGG
ncbi:MAG: alanine racemase [Actinomycetales bacterium]|nr:alanine racemase [Actinomycetales bacterium]